MEHWSCCQHKLQKFLTVLCENNDREGLDNSVDLTLFMGGRTKRKVEIDVKLFTLGVEK